MKIISWNVNGIRSATRQGFVQWLHKDKPDILCLQETKIDSQKVAVDLHSSQVYNTYWSHAEKKGYSGVAVYTKEKPLKVRREIDYAPFDKEGRVLILEYKKFTLMNLYIPNGSRDKSQMDHKIQSYKHLFDYLDKQTKPVILCGDFNIAHTEKDLERPKENKNNTMFTPEERELLDQLINKGFTDTLRVFNKEPKQYTWWPYAFNARERNLGWRIDYIFISKKLKGKLKNAFTLPQVTGSDHGPIGIEID